MKTCVAKTVELLVFGIGCRCMLVAIFTPRLLYLQDVRLASNIGLGDGCAPSQI
jgi:hypothetical protein